MKKLLTILAVGFAFALCAVPSFAAELYEDPNTGQLFTKPGEGRVPMTMPDEKAGALYEDPETGTVFTKPAPGRVAVIETTPQASQAVQEPPKKEEVMAVLPDWMQKIKLGGDFRLRYQLDDKEGDNVNARHRARYRLRVGATAQMLKSLEVGFGLASGENNDLRSTNQSFTGFISKKDIWIDYAYATFRPTDWLSVTGGRMKLPFWKPKDLVWDEDLNYEGAALNVAYQTEYPVELFLNSAFVILNETKSDDNDIYLYIAQPGFKYSITPDMDLRLMAAYYGVSNLKGANVTGVSGWTNTQETVGGKSVLKYDYDAININGEFGIKKVLPGYIDYVAVFGDYITSLDANTLNTGYQAGIILGDQKVKNAGDWQLIYNYRRLGRDAFIAIFPDSDFSGGATNTEGHEVEMRVGLLKDFNLKLDYYRAREITKNEDENLLQVDLNYTF